jgi:hypothetical protein
MPGDPIDRVYRTQIETLYSPVPRDDFERIIDSIHTLIEMGHDKKQPLKAALEYAVKLVFRQFDYREIAVGLLDRRDGFYRYNLTFGYRKDLDEQMHKIKYDHEDMVSNDRFPFIKTGRLSELDPAEGIPESERDWYKPFALAERRKSLDEFHEGDYIDVWMYSQNKELIGWFELSSPSKGKLPTRAELRWIELICGVCSLIVTERWADEDRSQPKPRLAPPPPRPR